MVIIICICMCTLLYIKISQTNYDNLDSHYKIQEEDNTNINT